MRTSLIALLVAALPAVASAGPIDIKLLGMGSSEKVSVAGVRNVTAMAGEIKWAELTGDLIGVDATFYSYCADLLSNAQTTQSVTQELSNSAIGWLYNQFAAAAHVNSAMAAGLQLAIWNVLYDKDFTVDHVLGGTEKFWLADGSAGARYFANDFLGKLATAGALSGTVILLNTNWGQDQITGGAPVPEPATLLLLGSGIAALAARRRMRKNSNSMI